MSETKYLDRGQGKIAYEEYGGDGPLVVCIPGMGIPRSVYRFAAPALAARGYHVVAFDLRGIGESSVAWDDYSEGAIASDVVALIDRLGRGPAVVVGNSIGAGAAVCVASRSPASVAALVLVAPFARSIPTSRIQTAFTRLLLARPWGAGVWANYQKTRLYPRARPADLDAFTDAVRANLKAPGRLRAFQRMAFTAHHEADGALAGVRAPTLVVMGDADPDFPDPKAEATIIAERTHGSVLLVPGAGHYPQAELPEEFVRGVVPFLDGLRHGA